MLAALVPALACQHAKQQLEDQLGTTVKMRWLMHTHTWVQTQLPHPLPEAQPCSAFELAQLQMEKCGNSQSKACAQLRIKKVLRDSQAGPCARHRAPLSPAGVQGGGLQGEGRFLLRRLLPLPSPHGEL